MREDPAQKIDLKELVDRLQLRGISLPVLIRFTDILRHRLSDIHAAFQANAAHYDGLLAELAVDGDVPARLFDEAEHLREPEPGALAGHLGGEERLERALEHLA